LLSDGSRARLTCNRLTVACLMAAVLAASAPPRTASGQTAPSGKPTVTRLAGADRIETAIAISQEVFETAPAAVVARADDFADALVGAPLAARIGGPILLTGSDMLAPSVADELERLGASEVVLLGGERAIGPAVEQELDEDYEVSRAAGNDRFDTAAAVAALLPESASAFVATGFDFPDALAAAASAAFTGRPILLVAPGGIPPATAEALEVTGREEVVVLGGPAAVSQDVEAGLAREGRTVRRLAGASRFETAAAVYDDSLTAGLDPAGAWLATAFDFPDALAAGPAVAAVGETLLLVDGAYLDRGVATAQRLRDHRDVLRRVVLLGGDAAIAPDTEEQLQGTLQGAELPGGGRILFPEFRAVAFYGGAQSARLGVLGETDPDEAGRRLLAQAGPYGTPDRPLLPTFELITTIATQSAGEDGDYSSPLDAATVQRYLDAVRRIGGVLLLDLQPGQSDFLSQARLYEQFLVQPDVGLALDPEWRMPPGRAPGEVIGSVDAAEVNAVIDYVAGLVRRERLPQKLFVVHQFRTDMITNREQIAHPNGLAVTIHVDGFGSRSAKLSTYDTLRTNGRYFTGFKLFYDEDTNLYSPEETLQLEPSPDLVTYQ